jgi:hypothetical protein
MSHNDHVADAQHAVVDGHLTASLVKLPDADDVAPESGDELYIGEGAVLAVLALEDDGDAPANLHTRAVAELHCADNARVEIGEGLVFPDNVVTGTGVQVPQLPLLVGAAVTVLLLALDMSSPFVKPASGMWARRHSPEPGA